MDEKFKLENFFTKDRDNLEMLKQSLESKKFEKEYNLKFSELEKLLNPSREIYDDIEFILKNEKDPFTIDGLRHDPELEIQSIITKLS